MATVMRSVGQPGRSRSLYRRIPNDDSEANVSQLPPKSPDAANKKRPPPNRSSKSFRMTSSLPTSPIPQAVAPCSTCQYPMSSRRIARDQPPLNHQASFPLAHSSAYGCTSKTPILRPRHASGFTGASHLNQMQDVDNHCGLRNLAGHSYTCQYCLGKENVYMSPRSFPAYTPPRPATCIVHRPSLDRPFCEEYDHREHAFSPPKRCASQTAVYTPRTLNMRSSQGSSSDISYRRSTSTSNPPPPRSNYSAHRERLRREKEQQDAALRQRLEAQQRHRQLAASTGGLHEHHQQTSSRLRNQSSHDRTTNLPMNGQQQQHRYRSLSAVNAHHATGGESFEGVETIVLQPIGSGVRDIDSKMGSLSTLARGSGGSMLDGIHRTDARGHSAVTRGDVGMRGYSSQQYLNRDLPTTRGLDRTNVVHQSQQIGQRSHNQSYQAHPQAGFVSQQQHSSLQQGSQTGLSTTSSTIVGTAPHTLLSQRTWANNSNRNTGAGVTPSSGIDRVDSASKQLVRETANQWYQPKLSREGAINFLRRQPTGSFLIRDSTTYKDAFGLAVKVAKLPAKVTPKSSIKNFVKKILNDLDSELVRHYLIEAVNRPERGVRLKGFVIEPIFPSLADLIHQHTIESLALPCRLILPQVNATMSQQRLALPTIVVGWPGNSPTTPSNQAAVYSTGASQLQSVPPQQPHPQPHYLAVQSNGLHQPTIDGTHSIGEGSLADSQAASTSLHQSGAYPPYTGIIPGGMEATCSSSSTGTPSLAGSGQTIALSCILVGSVDVRDAGNLEMSMADAVDLFIPGARLTSQECDQGASACRYTEVQLHANRDEGITLVDISRKLFETKHFPVNQLRFCGLERRNKEFNHIAHQLLGAVHPKLFGIIFRKNAEENTVFIFSECDQTHNAESAVRFIQSIYSSTPTQHIHQQQTPVLSLM